MTTMTSTSKAGLKVTTHVTVIDRTGVDNAVDSVGDILIPGDWRMICNEHPEPLRMLDDEPCGMAKGLGTALIIEAVFALAVWGVALLWRAL